MSKLFQELQRRNVFKAAISYIVISWALLQASDLLLPLLGFSKKPVLVLFYLLLVGFPIWLVFAYRFEWTPEGFKRTADVAPETSVTQQTSLKLNTLIMGGLVIAVAFLIVDRFTNFSGANDAGSDRQLSVAVLPFENKGGEDQAYFADGVTEDILTQLSKINSLRVLSRFTLKEYDTKGKSIEQIGKELGVDYLLMGSIRKAGEELRITCQLVQVNPEQQTWADNYDRRLENIFAVQAQVAEEVALSLQVSLSKTEKEQIAQQPTENIAAYNFYLKAREEGGKNTQQGFLEAIRLYQRAIALDPGFGLAHAGLAFVWSNAYRQKILPEQYLDSAQAALEKAMALAPKEVGVWNAAGALARAEGKLDVAEAHYRKALELNPNASATIGNLAVNQAGKGRLDEAILLTQKALSLNPLSASGYFNLLLYYTRLGMYDQAGEALQNALELGGESYSILNNAIILHQLSGEPEKARHYLDRLTALGETDKRIYPLAAEWAIYLKDYPKAKTYANRALAQEGAEEINQFYLPYVLGYMLWQEGKLDSAKTWLDPDKAFLEQELKRDPKNKEALEGLIYNQAIRGNKQEAIGYLERLLDAGDIRPVGEYTTDPRLAGLLAEPRFQTLMQRMEKRTETQRLNVLVQERKLNRPGKR